MTDISRNDCLARDNADPLAGLRDEFLLPGDVIYLDGNSLGPLTRRARERLVQTADREWGQGLIRSWNDAGWFVAPKRLGDKVAPLIGAQAGEVVVTDSTSVNLYKLLAGAMGMRPGRGKILSQRGNFPTDLYVAEGVAGSIAGGELVLADAADLADALDRDVAVLSLTHFDYQSGRVHDMAALTAAAHRVGALALWDLSHSTGALPVDLNAAGADLAVGCGYKYLNGGPGAPAFLFVADRHQADFRQPLSGWWGHRAPFAFVDDYQPADGITKALCGTQPMLAMAALEAALDLWQQVDLAIVREKSVAMTDLFIDLVTVMCPELELVSPCDPAVRGSQVSFRHAQGYAVIQALIADGVIGDFRDPDILRFGFAPLYNSFTEVYDAAAALHRVMAERRWDRPAHHRRAAVT